ncbi:MAG: phosphatidylglycerol lysyltransferase domain-containing protein [Treponema sp.]|nr:phosphatidylglycerol lysyltransferase domain-containing protein [Treponema sp.]
MNLLDFEYLENNLDTKNLYGSDSCIANLFLLQKKYNTQLKIHKNILFRYYTGDENNTGYGFPIPLKSTRIENNDGWLKDAIDFIFEESSSMNQTPSFCFIAKDQREQLDSFLSKYHSEYHISWKTNSCDYDYIYLQKNLSELQGAQYQKKRNHISRFYRTYGNSWVYKSFSGNDISSDFLKVAEDWFFEKNDLNNQALELEQQAIKLAIKNAKLLNLSGGILYIDGNPIAMTLASPISNNVLDVIYEKCIKEHEQNGAYAMINQQFAKNCGSYKYINREEDLGIPGLRKAKLSYKPEMILEKWYGKLTKG